MSTRSLGLSEELNDYLVSVSVRPDPLWERLRDETMDKVGINMQISPEQGQFLTLLLHILNAKKALEVGTFTGYSSLCIARALPPEGHLIACDVSSEWTDIGKRYWQEAGIADKIDLRIAKALKTLDSLIADGHSDTFDFAFIDADKKNYVGYYEKCMELVRPGGIIAVDNALWGGTLADTGKDDPATVAIRTLNLMIYNDDRVESSLLPVGDGLHLVRRLS